MILPRIFEILTRHARQPVVAGRDFEWNSNAWVHNCFRVFEVLFGRRAGIRAQLSAYKANGRVVYRAHSIEGAFSLVELGIRSLPNLIREFRFVPITIYIPLLQTPMGPIPVSPYLFAIALDNTNSHDHGSNTNSDTWAFTCTGSNLTLVVDAFNGNGTASGNGATITYAGASMTLGTTSNVNGDNRSWMGNFYKASPSTGSNNIVVTSTIASGTNSITSGAISLTGTNAAPIGASGASTGSSTTPSVSLTTTTANSWVVDGLALNDTIATENPTTTGTNQTMRFRQTENNGGHSLSGSTQTTTTAGSYTQSWSVSPSVTWGMISLEILPVGSSPTPTGPVRQATNLATAGTTETISLDFTGTAGSNLMLIVCFPSGQTNLGSNPYTATYNGVSLTSAGSYNGTVIEPGQIMYLAAPDISAAHNLVVTKASGAVVSYVAFIIQDAVQVSPIDQTLSHNSSASGTSATTNTRTSTSTSLNIAQININQPSSFQSVRTGTQIGTTYQQTSYESVYGMVGILPATGGADSIVFGWTTSEGWDAAIVSIKYQAPAVANGNFLSFM